MGESLPVIPVLTVLIAALIAAITDLRQFKVHNWLTVPLLLSGLIYHGVSRWLGFTDRIDFADSMFGALFGFIILVGFYLLGGMGAGDVKLMAAVGAWLGFKLTLYVFIASSLVAGIYALVLMVKYRKVGETWVNLQVLWHRVMAIGHHLGGEDRVEEQLNRSDCRRRAIPFALMVAVGFIAMLIWSMVTSN